MTLDEFNMANENAKEIAQAILETNAAAVKLPTFYSWDIDMWIGTVEGQFRIHRITSDQSKFDHVMAALDQNALKRVADLIKNPPEVNKYGTLKKALTRQCGKSKEEKIDTILRHPGLGDMRPSDLMSDFLALHDGHDCLILKRIFISHMPPPVAAGLAKSAATSLRDLGEEADVLWLAQKSSHPKPSVFNASSDPEIDAARMRQNRRDRPDLCYYHNAYGKKARNCKQPCSWKPNPPNQPNQGNLPTGRQ